MSQEFHNNEIDLVKQKEFCPYEYMNDFDKFREQLSGKKKFYILLTGKKLVMIMFIDHY